MTAPGRQHDHTSTTAQQHRYKAGIIRGVVTRAQCMAMKARCAATKVRYTKVLCIFLTSASVTRSSHSCALCFRTGSFNSSCLVVVLSWLHCHTVVAALLYCCAIVLSFCHTVSLVLLQGSLQDEYNQQKQTGKGSYLRNYRT